MEEKKVSTLFEEIKEDLEAYVSKRLELLKIQGYSKGSKSGALLIYLIGLLFLGLIVLNLVFATLAIYLGDVLNNLPLGFAIVSLFTILIVLILILTKKSIVKKLRNIIVSFLMDDNKE